MPHSKDKLRVIRSTASTRSKASNKKYTEHTKPKADQLSSPGWVTGHTDLFKVPNHLSPRGPKTRRSSIYQKAASPTRYRNAKIPASNCRKTRPLKTSMSASPPAPGVITRSRRASSIYLKADTPQAPTVNPQRDNPVMENLPVRGRSEKSVKSITSSRVSQSGDESLSEVQDPENFQVFMFPDSIMEDFPDDSRISLDPASSSAIAMSGQESPSQAVTPQLVASNKSRSEAARSTRSSVKCRPRSKTPSAVSVVDAKSGKGSTSPQKSITSIFPVQKSSTRGSPMPKSTTSISPTSDYVIIPCESDPEISFNTSRQDTPRKPASKRFLESIEDSPPPVTTHSFFPTASKVPRLSRPTVSRSERLLRSNTSGSTPTSAENFSDMRSPITSMNSIQKTSVTDSNLILTPADSRRELTLRDISNTPSSLDNTGPLETFQTPMVDRTCQESETFYETPQVSNAHNPHVEESPDCSGHVEIEDVSLAEPRRCIIL